MRRGTYGALGLLAALTLVAAGCGKSADEVTGDSSAATPATSAAATAPAEEASSAVSEVASAAESAAESAAVETLPTESTVATEGATADGILTPAPTGELESATWGVYRETQTLDPIYAFDYPDNTAIAAMCEALLRQKPDGSIEPGLATDVSYTDPTTLVITLREGVTFWDGTPVTADDVVYSLDRNRNPELGGFYGATFSRVDTIEATSPTEVTLKLTEPDTWLRGELSSMPGVIVQKAYAEEKGTSFGTVDGGTMCTGAFKLDSWQTGEGVTIARNDAYWDPALTPKVQKITIKGIPDDTAITSGLLTGELSGMYPIQLTTLDQLRESDDVKVYEGPSYALDALIISNLEGAFSDVRVRQALSMAIDRQGLIDINYKGAASLPRDLANPGTWGYAPEVFAAAYDALPEPSVDLEAAKALIKEAGAEGKTITLGMSSELPALNTEASAVKSAAESIGLKVELESVSAANYINYFIDPEARKNVDGFFTANYPDYADPAALLATLTLADGSQNYSGYANPEVTAALEAARTEPDDVKRATLVTQALAITAEDLPWIPIAFPTTVLAMRKELTGAPASFQYMFGPWAAPLGAAG